MRDSAVSELVRAIRAKQCVLFVGAGLSKSAGLPLWDELIEDMKPLLLGLAETEFDRDEEAQYLERAGYLDVATRFKFKAGLGYYHSFLQSRFRPPRSQPTEAHKALARIGSWPFIITTNFDKLLEVAFSHPGRMSPAVVTEPDELIVSLRSGSFSIIKLHGDIDRPQSIVLARDEYEQFMLSRRGQILLDTLRQQLIFRTVVFVGFGLTDPNFLRVFGEAGWLANGYQGDAFCIMAHTTKPEREEWQRRRMRVIPLASYEELAPFLNNLADRVAGLGENVVVVNALSHDVQSPREFLTTNPFFQVSHKYAYDWVSDQLGIRYPGFSANFLESEEISERYKISYRVIEETNHLLVTITRDEIGEIPANFWHRMPCDRETLIQHVETDRKIVFGVQETDGLYTLLVVAANSDSLRTAVSDFLNLSVFPAEKAS